MRKLPMWRWWMLNGRIRKRAIQHPPRERLQVRNALRRLKYRYREAVPFWNPLHRGVHKDLDGGFQWLDFVFRMPNGHIAIILFDHKKGRGPKEWEVSYLKTKEQYLHDRKIPYLKLSRSLTSQEYEITLYIFTKRSIGE